MEDNPNPSNDLETLAEEVGRGCLSSRDLPRKHSSGNDQTPKKAAGVMWGVWWFVRSSVLIALALNILVGVLVKMEISPNHLLACIFTALALAAIIFGALAHSTNPRWVRLRPLFVGLLLSYLLGMAGIMIFCQNFKITP